MLRTYVYFQNKQAWIEEKNLLLKDICAFLDENKKIVYIWKGPKSTREKFKKGYNSVQDLISSYPDSNFQLRVLKKEIPEEIQKEIDRMLELVRLNEEKEKLVFSRLITIRTFFILTLLSVILAGILILNLSSSLLWSSFGRNLVVNANRYDRWIESSRIIVILSLIVFGINVTIGIFEQDHQVILFNASGFIICLGIVFFLNQGIYLFVFQEGSTLTNYLILKRDILIFAISNLIAILLFEIPNLYKLFTFLKTYRRFIF